MLAMACYRMIAKRAIEGRTWAGNNVLDSPGRVEDLRDNNVVGQDGPFVAIYVDEGGTEGVENVKDSVSLYDPTMVTLVIESGSVGSYQFTSPANGEEKPRTETVTSLNATDSGTELTINMMSRQAADALMDTRPEAVFAELWRALGDIKSFRIVRGGPRDDERAPRVRYASQVIIVKADLLAEPAKGANLNDYPVWKRMLDVFAADPEFTAIGDLIRAHLQVGVAGVPIADWQLAAKLLNLTKGAVEGLGIAPVMNQENPAQKFEEITPARAQATDFPFPEGFYTENG